MAEESRGPGRGSDATPGAAGDAAEESVLTLICVKCGMEYYFSEAGPPEGISCEKCGNTVFRPFDSESASEAAEDFRESTERDLDADDAEGDTLPGDVLDLNRD